MDFLERGLHVGFRHSVVSHCAVDQAYYLGVIGLIPLSVGIISRTHSAVHSVDELGRLAGCAGDHVAVARARVHNHAIAQLALGLFSEADGLDFNDQILMRRGQHIIDKFLGVRLGFLCRVKRRSHTGIGVVYKLTGRRWALAVARVELTGFRVRVVSCSLDNFNSRFQCSRLFV